MKKQINPTIKAHLIRGAFYLLLLLAVCAIPFALAQSRTRGTAKQSFAKPLAAPNPDTNVPQAQHANVPQIQRQAPGQMPASADSVLNHLDAQPSKQAKAPWFFPNHQPSGIDCNSEPGIIIHDDGTIENGYSGNPGAGVTEVRFVDKFTPTSYPKTYSSVCLDFVTLAGGPPTYPVDIVVYDDDGAGGSPGTLLGSLNAQPATTHIFAAGQMPIWNSYNISGLALNITSGSVYIGARWMPPAPTNVYMSADQTGAVGFAGGYWWNNNANAWATIQTAFPAYHSCMIRAVEGPAGPSPTASPSPTATATATPCTAQYTVAQIGGAIVPGTTDIGNHGDDTVTTVALPFPYSLYGQSFTSINLSSNGNAQFMTTDATFTNVCLPWAAHNYTIFPYWDDLYLVNSGFGIFTSVSGTAPNRIFNIEWRAQYFPGNGTANFELRLYEGQSRFDVIYGTVDNGNTSATGGVQKDVAPNFTQYFCNGAGGAATGGQSYTLQPCGTPSPTPTATATATGSPSGCCVLGAWATATPGPPLRYRAGGCTDGTYVYVYGGGDDVGGFRNDLWRWDPTTETWTQLANMPTAKQNIQGAYWNGKIYVPGGFTGAHITENAIYDIATNTWSTGAPLPAPQTGTNVAFNNKIYNFGGNPGPQATVTIYDIATNTWSPGAPMPVPITYGRATKAGNFAYYAGGITTVTINTLYRYDFAANTWATMAPLQTARTSEELMTSPDGCKLYAVMGGDATFFTGVPLPVTVEIYDIAANSWTYGNPVVTKAAAPSGGLAGNKAMVQGGVDNTTYYNLVQVAPLNCQGGSPTPTATPTATGSPSCTPGPIILQGSIDDTEPFHNSVNGAASSCAVSPACPGELAGEFHYDTYQLTNPSSNPACITVTLSDATCIYSEVYLGSFDPNNACTNYLADSNLGPSYQVTVPGNAAIVLVVEEFTEMAGCPSYTVTVDGLGSCPSPTPTVSPTATPTATFTPTATATATFTPTATATATFTPTATATATATATTTATAVPRSTPTPRPRPTPPPRP